MIAHRQKKRRRYVISGCEDRYAVLLLPIGIFDEAGLKPGRNSARPKQASRGPIFASGEDCRYTEDLIKAA
ncbi:MAG: hypothetical protein DME59_05750 [Verrucomicrobia bacterium]|nr:MAG: hypothetical protein DME59_05750 [Verrucomicrobiota bacterium]PYL77238.1 MAG: hypothetical protein DMF26_04725 [Verrucomicrobiota bacterium]